MKKIIAIAKLSWEFSARYYLVIFLLSVLSGGQMLLSLYIPAKFVEAIVSGIVNASTMNLMFLLVFSNLIFHLSIRFFETRLEIEKVYVNDMVNLKMSDKIMHIGYEKIETPYYLDLRQRALYSIETQDALANMLLITANLIRKIAVIIELVVIVCLFSKLMMGIIVAFDLIIAIYYIVFKKYEKKFNENMIGYNRKFSYYLGLCFEDTLQKDIRLYQMDEMLTNKVRSENKKILNYKKKYYSIRGMYNGIVSLFSIVQTALAYTFVIYRTFSEIKKKLLGYGEFTFYINTIIKLFNSSKEIIYDIVNLSQMLAYLEPFILFMSIEDDENIYGSIEIPDTVESIEFKNVSFCYPGTDKMILSDVSFYIDAKEKISLVGLNGAGKTTIIKLLCRLYKPTTGQILLNGINIWDYEKEGINSKITTVFQDYKMFAISIKENITCSLNSYDSKIGEWLHILGLDYLTSKYEKGIDTVLNKAYEDEGTDLSGGEKQKLAIARALNKGGDIFILDEPTSSLDPKAEAEVFSQFEALTKDKMTIYVSHRMSSSKLCDRVLVLNSGKIIDSGTHEELIGKKSGLYYQMFMAQANNYNSSEK